MKNSLLTRPILIRMSVSPPCRYCSIHSRGGQQNALRSNCYPINPFLAPISPFPSPRNRRGLEKTEREALVFHPRKTASVLLHIKERKEIYIYMPPGFSRQRFPANPPGSAGEFRHPSSTSSPISLPPESQSLRHGTRWITTRPCARSGSGDR